MSRRKQLTRLESIAEDLKLTDLRLRLAPDLGRRKHTDIALRELDEARKLLVALIKDVKKGKYP